MNSTVVDELEDAQLVLEVDHPLQWMDDKGNQDNPRPGVHKEIVNQGWTLPGYTYSGPGNDVGRPELAELVGDLVAWCHDLDFTRYEEVFGREGIHNVNDSDLKMSTMIAYLRQQGLAGGMDALTGALIGGPKTWYSQVNDAIMGEEPIHDPWTQEKAKWVDMKMKSIGVGDKGRDIMFSWSKWDPRNEKETAELASKMVSFMNNRVQYHDRQRVLFGPNKDIISRRKEIRKALSARNKNGTSTVGGRAAYGTPPGERYSLRVWATLNHWNKKKKRKPLSFANEIKI